MSERGYARCMFCGMVPRHEGEEHGETCPLGEAEARVASLEYLIREALHDLPDKGADAASTLRAALGLPDDD